MAINAIDDVIAPLAVVAADLGTETAAPQWNEWVAYGIVVAGYAAMQTGFGGRQAGMYANAGIAAVPWAAKKLYNRFMSPVSSRGAALRPVNRRVSSQRWPAPSNETQFRGAQLT